MIQEAHKLPNGMIKVVNIPDSASDDPMTFVDEIILMYEKEKQEQQKKIDALEAENPQVDCPECNNHENEQMICFFCREKGKVPLTKAQEYRIKELEEKLAQHKWTDRMIEEAR